MKKITIAIFVTISVVFGGVPAHADYQKQILVVDKCPEFCPKTKQPTIKMCAQVLIPVPGKPGWWYTDSCKTKMIKAPNTKK